MEDVNQVNIPDSELGQGARSHHSEAVARDVARDGVSINQSCEHDSSSSDSARAADVTDSTAAVRFACAVPGSVLSTACVQFAHIPHDTAVAFKATTVSSHTAAVVDVVQPKGVKYDHLMAEIQQRIGAKKGETDRRVASRSSTGKYGSFASPPTVGKQCILAYRT